MEGEQGETEMQEQETQHEGNINDCQFDFYGLSLASCDSNGFVQVCSINKDPNSQAT